MHINTKFQSQSCEAGPPAAVAGVSVHFYNLSKTQISTSTKNHENIYILAHNDHTVSFKNY